MAGAEVNVRADAARKFLEAVRVLAGIRGAHDLEVPLRRLLSDKSTSQYGTTYMTVQKAGSMLRQAEKLVDGMDRLLRRQ